MNLFYNAFHPLEILSSLTIKTSFVTRDRGVSMSCCAITSHGPFSFVFKPDLIWYAQFQPVQYGQFEEYDFLHKNEMFTDEHEYWSPTEVRFKLEDIQSLYYRKNSAGARIYPRKNPKIAKQLLSQYGKYDWLKIS